LVGCEVVDDLDVRTVRLGMAPDEKKTLARDSEDRVANVIEAAFKHHLAVI